MKRYLSAKRKRSYRGKVKSIMSNSTTNNNHHHNNDQFEKLCDSIFALSPNIRFVGVIDRMGKLIAGGMRQGLKSMENKQDSSKLYLEFALRNEMRKEFDAEFGKTIYSFSEREKIKLASFPLNDHLLRVSIDKIELHHAELIENILKLVIKNNKRSLADSGTSNK